MTPQNPLQALHPLREPAAVGWWPPAPGWWFLAVLCLVLLTALGVWGWRRRRRNRYRRQAMTELKALGTDPLQGSERVQQINAVLKRAALMAYGTTRVAALGGDGWIRFLNATLPRNRQAFADIDGDILYRPKPSPTSIEAFAEAAAIWVRHHQRESGNA